MSRYTGCLSILIITLGPALVAAETPRDKVERAIREGLRCLKTLQRADGSWPDVDNKAYGGTTSLATLALLECGEPVDSPAVTRAVEWLRALGPDAPGPGAAPIGNKARDSIYATALQTMVFAAVDPEQDRERIVRNARWLEGAQIKARERTGPAGSWTYGAKKVSHGDGSNTYYAMLGLDAAAEVGVQVRPETWALATRYWTAGRNKDRGWGYLTTVPRPSTANMTCEGVSALILARTHRGVNVERTEGGTVRDCGKGIGDHMLHSGIDWLAIHFGVKANYGDGFEWRFHYLESLARVGQLTGLRRVGSHDWYLEGAAVLIESQATPSGGWRGTTFENSEVLATSFALMFLARGRTPILVQKAMHGPGADWTNDPDDVRNLVKAVGRDWKKSLGWRVVDPGADAADDLLAVPVLFLNGHLAPVLTPAGKEALRGYVERGGLIFAEACCGRAEFDKGIRTLVRELFPDPDSELRQVADDHPVWHSLHDLDPRDHPLWGMDRGGRTALFYSPGDLSCGWNQRGRSPEAPATSQALRVGQNVIDYATDRKPPLDRLAADALIYDVPGR